jgi:hypothetical protein
VINVHALIAAGVNAEDGAFWRTLTASDRSGVVWSPPTPTPDR